MTDTRKPMTAIEVMARLFHVDQKLTRIHYLQAEQETLFNETIDLLCELARNYEKTLTTKVGPQVDAQTKTNRQAGDYAAAHGGLPG